MTVNTVSNISHNRPNKTVVVNNKKYDPRFGNSSLNESKKDERNVRLGVFASTLAGVGIALAIISKKQGFTLNPKKIFTQSPKDWAIFKIVSAKDKTRKDLKLHEAEIISIGAGSVLGGLAGGFLFDDKKNRKAKLKESVNQMLGDIMIPLAFVAAPTRAYKAFESLATKATKHAKLQDMAKYVVNHKFLKNTIQVLVSGISLGVGIIAGNRFSNFINEKVYGEKVERKIKATDFAPHLDDVCLAVTLMAGERSVLGSVISKFVPAALSVAGNVVGNTKADDHKPKV